jgi:hypothetical protein
MTPETLEQLQVPAPADEQPAIVIEPSDYATGFVEGFLRAHGISGPPEMPQFRAALAELAQHLSEVRRRAN